jgi:hypothetical protein
MRIYSECIVCLFRLALRTARLATADERLQREVLKHLAGEISELPEDAAPIEAGRWLQEIVGKLTGVADPYRQIKRRYNDLALALYPRLKELVKEADDPLGTAIRLAIAGNVIDFAAGSEFDLERAVEESPEWEFSIFDYEVFLERLATAEEILYLGDNAGEIVFDGLLIEELLRRGKRVTYAVRGGPAINDVTLEEARYVGLNGIVEVITTGAALPGVMLTDCSPQFIEIFKGAKLIISKGQGNFEGLSDEQGPIIFLLKAKCSPIAGELGVEPGAMVLRAGPVFELERTR